MLKDTPVEDIDIVEQNKDYLLASFSSDQVIKCPSTALNQHLDKILLVSEFSELHGSSVPITESLRVLDPKISPIDSAISKTPMIFDGQEGFPILEHAVFSGATTGVFPPEPPSTGPKIFEIFATVTKIAEEEEESNGVFAVFRSGDVSASANINVVLLPGSGRAEHRVDYFTVPLATISGANPPTVGVSFAPGQRVAFVNVLALDDSRFEGTEVVFAELRNPPAGSTISTTAATSTISIVETESSLGFYMGMGQWMLLDLGPIGQHSTVSGINNRKLGNTESPQICGSLWTGTRWRSASANFNTLSYVPEPANVKWSRSLGIGENGWVVGDFELLNSICSCAMVWNGVATTFMQLPAVGGQSAAHDLVEFPGVKTYAIGDAYLSGIPNVPVQSRRAVYWALESGGSVWQQAVNMGTLETTPQAGYSYAKGVNRSGHVTGTSTVSGGTALRAFRTTSFDIPGEIKAIDRLNDNLGTLSNSSLSTSWSEGVDINDLGEVVGHSTTTSGAIHVFLKHKAYQLIQPDGTLELHNSDTAMRDLLPSSGTANSKARGINNRGYVVAQYGYTSTSVGDPILIQNDGSGSWINVNSLAHPTYAAGWQLKEVVDINDSNRIVGIGLFGGVQKAFVLIPPN